MNAPVGSRYPVSCVLELLRLVTSDDIMTSLSKMLSIPIKINSRSQTAMETVWSVSKLSTEFVGSRRELVANSAHTADTDATQLGSRVASASAVCMGLRGNAVVPCRRWNTAMTRCETSFFVCVGGQNHVTLMTPPPTSNTLKCGTDNATTHRYTTPYTLVYIGVGDGRLRGSTCPPPLKFGKNILRAILV